MLHCCAILMGSSDIKLERPDSFTAYLGRSLCTLPSGTFKIYKNKQTNKKNPSHPGLEKSSFGPVPEVEPAPVDGSKPQMLEFCASVTQLQRSPAVSKSQPETQAVEGKTKVFRFCLCV